ncbi:hypothetical protein [Streptomyces bikiniensis]|uniref:hypothetical protein n=1 Tax=Streptomyces bikiniensis TaxID=1896 RepID=UPI000AF58EA5|nr:hypothetical protein [Streptomyces bikiniensis]
MEDEYDAATAPATRVGPFAPTPEPTWYPPASYVDVRPYEPLPQDPYGTTPAP